MNLRLVGLDDTSAGLELRECLSFTESGARETLRRLSEEGGVEGAVLLATCNRTELYLSGGEGLDPPALLRAAASSAHPEAASLIRALPVECLRQKSGEDAARHLMEVACGLRSRILCEDQIITQVKRAALLAREEGTADPVLETLFRLAATAAKKAKTTVTVKAVPASAAEAAVRLAEKRLGGLSGRRGMVVGNGEMGRLCAARLAASGCRTVVTLRSYRHGETAVPCGCETVPYDQRETLLAEVDFVISATASPHFTLTRAMLERLPRRPGLLLDLAVPRDIEPSAGELAGVECLNIDQIGCGYGGEANAAALERIRGITGEYLRRFIQWLSYRERGDEPPEDAFFPLFVDLWGKKALVVGGGAVAARRAEVLIRYGAAVTVVSPAFCTALTGRADGRRLAFIKREYRPGDCAGSFLVVAASDDREANRLAAEEAAALGILASVADRRGEGSFLFPAVFEGGGVTGGLVSLGGRDHALVRRQAKRIRELLDTPEADEDGRDG